MTPRGLTAPPIMQRVVYEGPEPGSYVHCGDLVLFLQQPVSRLYQLSRVPGLLMCGPHKVQYPPNNALPLGISKLGISAAQIIHPPRCIAKWEIKEITNIPPKLQILAKLAGTAELRQDQHEKKRQKCANFSYYVNIPFQGIL